MQCFSVVGASKLSAADPRAFQIKSFCVASINGHLARLGEDIVVVFALRPTVLGVIDVVHLALRPIVPGVIVVVHLDRLGEDIVVLVVEVVVSWAVGVMIEVGVDRLPFVEAQASDALGVGTPWDCRLVGHDLAHVVAVRLGRVNLEQRLRTELLWHVVPVADYRALLWGLRPLLLLFLSLVLCVPD